MDSYAFGFRLLRNTVFIETSLKENQFEII